MIHINPIQTSLSALTAHRKAFEATAHNIANMNTEGYQPVTPTFESVEGGGVHVRYQQPTQAPPEGQSGTDLEQEVVNSIVYSAGYQANLATIRNQMHMLGNVIDMVG